MLDEADGTVGTICLYQATSADALAEHARAADLPAAGGAAADGNGIYAQTDADGQMIYIIVTP